MKIKRLFLSLAAICIFAGRSWASDLINVDFDQVGNAAFHTKVGPAAIGLTSNDFWNDYPGANALKWSDGTLSPVTLTGSAPPPWYTWNYDAMFQSYTYSSDPITLNIAGLPAGAYDFYVYAHGQPTNEIGKIELKRGATSLGVKTTSSALDWDKPGWTEGGEYVVFRGVEVIEGQTVQLISSPGGLNGPAVLNGLQILNSSHTNFAPVISEDPYHRTVVIGGTIRLEPSILGTEPFRYQWKKNGQPIENATARVLEILAAQAGDEGTYSVFVENDFGSTTSPGTLVKMINATTSPIINIDVTNPDLPVYSTKTGPAVIGASNSDVWNAVVGAAANLKTSDGTTTSARAVLGNATGWWFSDNRDPMFLSYAAAASSLTLSVSDIPLGMYDVYVYAHGQAATEDSSIMVRAGDQTFGPKVTSSSAGWNPPGWTESYQYVVFRGVAVTNGALVIFSTRDAGPSAILNGAQIVRTGSVPPQIIQQPTSIIVSPGKSFTLSVVAAGDTLTYQWQKDGADVNGATSSSYTVDRAVAADHSGSYRVKVTNANGFVLSDAATVSVRYLPPVITAQPKSISVTESNSFTLQVVAASDAPLTYQWEHSGTNIDGAVSAQFTVPSATTNDTGSYRVKVSNEAGDTFSDVALVTIYGANVTLLDVNFGHESQIKVGVAATGLSSADFWNHYSFPFATFASMTNLVMVDQSPSSVGLTVENGPGQWYFSQSSGDIMYNNYIYVAGTITATLYNLPPGAYDLYLYGHADVDNANSVFTVKSGATSFGTQATTTEPGAWKLTQWVRNAQYVLFENIQVSSDPLVIQVGPGAYGQAFLNGLQLRFRGNVPPGPPTIITQPKNVNVSETRSAEFSVFAWGLGQLTYQWRHEGTNLPAATNQVLTIPAASLSDAGRYDVVVTGSDGSTTSNEAILNVGPADREPPVVTITSPTAGPLPNQTFTLAGSATDNQKVVSLTWELNGVAKGPLAFSDDGTFSLPNLTLIAHVENQIRVTAKDDFNNQAVAEVTVYWQAPRTFVVTIPPPVQEGARVVLPISLISAGDVSGSDFNIGWDTNYLADPIFVWADSVAQAFTTETVELNRKIHASFALPAITVPAGTTTVATVSFRARSVSANRTTPITFELIDVYGTTGDQFTSGNDYRSGSVSITKRKVKGDNNANDRLDVGDASIMMLLIGQPALRRPWDITGNDLNANLTLDSGDVIKVLRAVVGLDPQPTVTSPFIDKKSQSAADVIILGPPVVDPPPPVGLVALAFDKTTAAPGENVTVEVRLTNQTKSVSGASFRLEYPVDALRLGSDASRQVGSIVPPGSVSIWNLSPNQSNYATQDGAISLAVSTATAWATNNGVLARFSFTVQAGAAARYGWPVLLKNIEVSRDGFTTEVLSDTGSMFIGHAPIQPSFTPAITFDGDRSANLTLRGDIGATYRIEASNDLVNWSLLGTVYSSDGSIPVYDAGANQASARFYKATLIQ